MLARKPKNIINKFTFGSLLINLIGHMRTFIEFQAQLAR